ncbi:alpha-ketoglutarate-dependent dioxygenase AlkB family protein [Hymenobacter guriensis]|uniref:Alpha-ketoglutarate-dependent dioxygenase AlkB n=1 Tax=Hymenobacter guriensis TaxID=2793065 RepID=A0ABS0L2S0_9BACT|nr:alpha-ketoglutarate-dependent dioxygenase AlkB [Hymenobacter guriensis]MBG8554405.1 alpha-ketoglutarate-dependent dioxygenase AlkB [Hymenobacter guriensis]
MPLTLLSRPQAEVWLDENFLPAATAARLFEELQNAVPWRQESITLFGKPRLQPRLAAWYGDATAHYRYSGLTLVPLPWTPTLQQLRRQIEGACSTSFNSVLLNLYRSGQDSMGWHADDEPELGPQPVIASLSLGATRRFRLKPKPRAGIEAEPVSLDIASGSLLVMRGLMQQHWLHAVPKTALPVGPRLNLTFRHIMAG